MSTDNFGQILPHPDGGGVVLITSFASSEIGPINTGAEIKMTLNQAKRIAENEQYKYGYIISPDAIDITPVIPHQNSPVKKQWNFMLHLKY